MRQIMQIIFLIFTLIGLIGNLFNILVFSRKKMLKSFVNRLLLVLSTVDFFILILLSLETLVFSIYKTDLKTMSTLLCKSLSFLTFFLVHFRNTFSASILVKQSRILMKANQKARHVNSTSSRSLSLTQNKTLNSLRLKSEFFTQNDELTSLPAAQKIIRKSNTYSLVLTFVLIALVLVNFHFLLFVDIKKKPNSKVNSYFLVVTENQSNNNIYDSMNKSIYFMKDLGQQHEALSEFCEAMQHDMYDLFKSNIWFWIDMTLTFLLPCLIMTTAFACILKI